MQLSSELNELARYEIRIAGFGVRAIKVPYATLNSDWQEVYQWIGGRWLTSE